MNATVAMLASTSLYFQGVRGIMDCKVRRAARRLSTKRLRARHVSRRGTKASSGPRRRKVVNELIGSMPIDHALAAFPQEGDE